MLLVLLLLFLLRILPVGRKTLFRQRRRENCQEDAYRLAERDGSGKPDHRGWAEDGAWARGNLRGSSRCFRTKVARVYVLSPMRRWSDRRLDRPLPQVLPENAKSPCVERMFGYDCRLAEVRIARLSGSRGLIPACRLLFLRCDAA